jgi:predicted  nucleic acid-binding Zn-ribbon protein
MSATSTEMQDQGPKKGIVIIVILILLGTNGLLLWKFFEKKNSFDEVNKNLTIATQDKVQLQTELDGIKIEREKLQTENGQYKDQLSQEDSSLQMKEAQIQHLISIGGPAQLAKARAELSKLKEMNDLYALQMDSLNKVNTKLTSDVQNLNSNLTEQQNKNTDLTKQVSKLSDKVAAGSILAANNIVTQGIRIKSSGKEVPTSKAKQVQNMHTKFSLGPNRVIDAGPIDIYIRVLGPDGNVMSSSGQSFTAGGEAIVYTMKQTVQYNNTNTDVDAVWARGSQFTKGKYNVEIYEGGQIIGKSMVELK